MRNMSFMLTTKQIRMRTKTVTRRMGWEILKKGDLVCAIEKGQGLKKGEKVKRLAFLRVKSVRREGLWRMTDDWEYGLRECVKEGFQPPSPYSHPSAFVRFFCQTHQDCRPKTIITRIEFGYQEKKRQRS